MPFNLRIKLNNVSLRAFLYLLDQKNLKKELSNTTVCDYILKTFGNMFMDGYKDTASFRSGYAGNFSLLFDADDAQDGKMNKSTKILEPILATAMKRLASSKISFVKGKTSGTSYCLINDIPDEETMQLLSVFFILKPINAFLRIKISSRLEGWYALLKEKLSLSDLELEPNKAVFSGRGNIGTTSIISRYTIFNYGGNWFDVLKPSYYNFKNLRYKVFLHSLMIEQSNFYYVIPRADHYAFDVSTIFEQGIRMRGDEPVLNQKWLEKYLCFEDVMIIKKDDLRNLIINNVTLPSTCQYQFTVLGDTLVFADGIMIDLSPYFVTDRNVLLQSSSFNPNITFDLKREQRVRQDAVGTDAKPGRDLYRRLAINGEESNTIMKFIEKSFLGQLRIFDYSRDSKGLVVMGEKKTCLILYNGTKFPDLVCVFAEDAERTEPKGDKSWSEYASYIWQQYDRFAHYMFMVEAEFNLSSFKSHDTSCEYVLQSKYVFCENRSSEYFESKFGVHIPAVSIKDL